MKNSTVTQTAKIVVEKSKSWAVVKKMFETKTLFCVYVTASKGDRHAKKLFDIGDEKFSYWKFYIPSAAEIKLTDDAESALENDRNTFGYSVFSSGKEAFDGIKKLISGDMLIKDVLDRAFVLEEKMLRQIIIKAYPDAVDAKYQKSGWFVL